jgi:hypothetical protein
MNQPALRDPLVSRLVSPATASFDQLAVLGQMLPDIETTTRGGQVYMMRKIVDGLEAELGRRTDALADIGQRRVRRLLNDLRKQAARLAPVPSQFTDEAELAIALLRRAEHA